MQKKQKNTDADDNTNAATGDNSAAGDESADNEAAGESADWPSMFSILDDGDGAQDTPKKSINRKLVIDKDGRVIVQEGNTLSTIAQSLGVSLADLKDANPHINNDGHIEPDWKLNIPTKTPTAAIIGGSCPIPEGFFPDPKQIIKRQPKMELFARDVDIFFGLFQHGYTIYTYSDGRTKISTGMADPNMITGDMRAAITDYDKSGAGKLFPKSDWHENKPRTLIAKKEFSSDAELDYYLSIANDIVTFVNTGNNGQPFDYDACVTDGCFGGGNSNTLQALIMKYSNVEYTVPKGINLPGIGGEFVDGYFDNIVDKLDKAYIASDMNNVDFLAEMNLMNKGNKK